jgi:multimeric flavodoxin WrbA
VNAPSGQRPHVVAVLGSPRRKGNCAAVLGAALAELEARGAEVEVINLSAHEIRYCSGHDDCAERESCPTRDDAPDLLERVFAADAVIMASPVYADDITGQMKVFIDRGCHPYGRGRRLAARAVGLITVADSTGLDDTLATFKRALVYFCKDRAPVPIFEAKGYATLLGDAVKNGELMESGRMLGRDMADVLLGAG